MQHGSTDAHYVLDIICCFDMRARASMCACNACRDACMAYMMHVGVPVGMRVAACPAIAWYIFLNPRSPHPFG